MQLVDIVWDVYIKDSLKLSTRANRGRGTRKRMSSHALRNDDNKDELLQFLGHECVSKDTGDKVIISTILNDVVSSRDGQNTDGLQPCSR